MNTRQFLTALTNVILWPPTLRRIAVYPYRRRMPFLCDAPGRGSASSRRSHSSRPAHANVREARRYR